MRTIRMLVVCLLTGVVAYAVYAADFEGLGDLSGEEDFSEAYAVSEDGSVVVGRSKSTNGTEAFYWEDGEDMTGLGSLGGTTFSSEAYGVSADGGVRNPRYVWGSRRSRVGGKRQVGDRVFWPLK